MSLLNFARTDVETCFRQTTLQAAASHMKDKKVGCLVVVEEDIPVGILTDRDIVTRVVAVGGAPQTTKVAEVMTPAPVTLVEELGLFEALEIMKDKGVRRFPVINAEGRLSGFFTVDDVLYLFGLEMGAVARIVNNDIA